MEPATTTWGPFTGRQLTTIIVALIAGVVLLPGAVWAVDTFSNVAVQDPVSGVKASVDSSHRLEVAAAAAPRPPAHPFNVSNDVSNAALAVLVGPSSTPINVSALSVGFKSGTESDFYLYVGFEPTAATACSDAIGYTLFHWPSVHNAGTGITIESFPTPMQVAPPTGQKACLYGYSGGDTVTANLTGYTGK